jgi:hypothetical protein
MLTAPRYHSLSLSQNAGQSFCGISVVIIASCHARSICVSRWNDSTTACSVNGDGLCRRFLIVVSVSELCTEAFVTPFPSRREQIAFAYDLRAVRDAILRSKSVPADPAATSSNRRGDSQEMANFFRPFFSPHSLSDVSPLQASHRVRPLRRLPRPCAIRFRHHAAIVVRFFPRATPAARPYHDQ